MDNESDIETWSNNGKYEVFIYKNSLDSDVRFQSDSTEEFLSRRASSLEPFADMLRGKYKISIVMSLLLTRTSLQLDSKLDLTFIPYVSTVSPVVDPPAKRQRGQPRKTQPPDSPSVKRKRGRPRKIQRSDSPLSVPAALSKVRAQCNSKASTHSSPTLPLTFELTVLVL